MFSCYVHDIGAFERVLSRRGFACLCMVEFFFAETAQIFRLNGSKRSESRGPTLRGAFYRVTDSPAPERHGVNTVGSNSTPSATQNIDFNIYFQIKIFVPQ